MPAPHHIDVAVIAETEADVAPWQEVLDALEAPFRPVGVFATDGDIDAQEREPGSTFECPVLIVVHGNCGTRPPAFVSRWAGLRQIAWVLVETTPHQAFGSGEQPVMILRGRQSEKLPHAEAVTAFERVARGRLIELENCDHEPHRRQPGAVATALSWFGATFLANDDAEKE